jgi:hypothetical protein
MCFLIYIAGTEKISALSNVEHIRAVGLWTFENEYFLLNVNVIKNGNSTKPTISLNGGYAWLFSNNLEFITILLKYLPLLVNL